MTTYKDQIIFHYFLKSNDLLFIKKVTFQQNINYLIVKFILFKFFSQRKI